MHSCLSIYLYIYICLSIYLSVSIGLTQETVHICTQIRMHSCLSMCLYIYICLSIYLSVSIKTYNTYVSHVFTYICISYMCAPFSREAHTEAQRRYISYVCTQIRMHLCLSIHLYIYICLSIYLSVSSDTCNASASNVR